jgi:hypothetical protein
MAVQRKMVSWKAESELSGEDKLFLATYGGKMDFTDIETIKPLVDYVRTFVPDKQPSA